LRAAPKAVNAQTVQLLSFNAVMIPLPRATQQSWREIPDDCSQPDQAVFYSFYLPEFGQKKGDQSDPNSSKGHSTKKKDRVNQKIKFHGRIFYSNVCCRGDNNAQVGYCRQNRLVCIFVFNYIKLTELEFNLILKLMLEVVLSYAGIDAFSQEVNLDAELHSEITDRLRLFALGRLDAMSDILLEPDTELFEPPQINAGYLLIYYYFVDNEEEGDQVFIEDLFEDDEYPCLAVLPEEIGLLRSEVLSALNAQLPISDSN